MRIKSGGVEVLKDFKKVFINPTMIAETGKEWEFTEGCLSIPDIRERFPVRRKSPYSFWMSNLKNKL
jgi:peptide deformylase